jgi:hypothetical protein
MWRVCTGNFGKSTLVKLKSRKDIASVIKELDKRVKDRDFPDRRSKLCHRCASIVIDPQFGQKIDNRKERDFESDILGTPRLADIQISSLESSRLK